jgi:hypothetical protein
MALFGHSTHETNNEGELSHPKGVTPSKIRREGIHLWAAFLRLQEFSCSSQLPPLPSKCEQRGMEMNFEGIEPYRGKSLIPKA